jgi:sortase (surface protein transpeptidase)
VNPLRGVRAAFRSRRLLLASLLLAISLGLLAAGIAGLLLTGDDDPKLTNVGVPGPIGTETTTTPSPSSAPIARLIIEKIGVDAPVVTMGVDENGIPHTPDNPYDVVWYDFSTPPGHGSNAVFAGHYDWTVNHQPVTGVFYSLRQLGVGDIVEVKLDDGTDYKYSVIGNLAIPDGDPRAMEMMGATPSDMVTLITCGGVWTPSSEPPFYGSYDYRQVVRAELIGGEPPPQQPDEGRIEEPRQEEDSPG